MTLTPEQLAEWRRLAEAATAGPWSSGHSALPCPSNDYPHACWNIWEDAQTDVTHPHAGLDERDALFIAAARTAVPALIDEVERLQVELRRRSPGTCDGEADLVAMREMLETNAGKKDEPLYNILSILLAHVDNRQAKLARAVAALRGIAKYEHNKGCATDCCECPDVAEAALKELGEEVDS